MTGQPLGPPLVELRGIGKRFPGVVALADVDFHVRAGEVVALCGENGAGKSTLMKVLGGLYAPDAGEFFFDGQPGKLGGVQDAKRRGLALIHQELFLCPELDLAGNIFLGDEPRLFPGGPMRRGAMRQRAGELLRRVGLDLSPTTRVSRLTTGQQQMVEIAKALNRNARVLVMDEPTSSLTLSETRRLYAIVDELRQTGMGIVYISHRMDEVMRLADRVVVMRDGKNAGELDPKRCTTDDIVAKMVGRAPSQRFPARQTLPRTEIVFEAKDLVAPGAPAGVSFAVHAGEILGFAGLVGSGRTELMRVLFGIDSPRGGTMRLLGELYRPAGPGAAARAGVFLAPEDRKQHGVVLGASIRENFALPHSAPRFGLAPIRRFREAAAARAAVKAHGVRASSPRQKVVTLSGGNQQKVVLGKWLEMGPKLLILDEPTRGIDVGAKAEIYGRIAALADAGLAVLLVSSEMEEVLGLADRLVVLRERRLAGELARSQFTEERAMALMTAVAAA